VPGNDNELPSWPLACRAINLFWWRFSLLWTPVHSMKEHRRRGGITPLILHLDWRDWSTSPLGNFCWGERACSANGIGGWVGPRGVWAFWKRGKMSYPCHDSNPGSSSLWLVTVVLYRRYQRVGIQGLCCRPDEIKPTNLSVVCLSKDFHFYYYF
jgi:hypothetical protein